MSDAVGPGRPRALGGADRRPVLIAVGLGLGAALLGLRVGDALLVGLAALGVGVLWVSLGAGTTYDWPDDRTEESDGTRPEVSMLTWSFTGRDGRVSENAVRRLRDVAARRLARRGLPGVVLAPREPLDPQARLLRAQARDLLGERAWTTLTTAGGLLPTLGDVTHCVDVLEGLAVPGGPAAPASPAVPGSPAVRESPVPSPSERPRP